MGVKPVSLLASCDNVRSWPGGTGAFKIAGNYAPCFWPQVSAAKQGYQQILWLLEDVELGGSDSPAVSRAAIQKSQEMCITEAGQMNFFVVLLRDDGGGF